MHRGQPLAQQVSRVASQLVNGWTARLSSASRGSQTIITHGCISCPRGPCGPDVPSPGADSIHFRHPLETNALRPVFVFQRSLAERLYTKMIREMLGIAEGILQDLHNDHSEVDSLMDRIMESEDGAARAALF